MEFMRKASANAATICLDSTGFQSQAIKNSLISVVHGLVTIGHTLCIGIKGIGIFHNEFACAHDTESRPNLISKLGLNLVQVERQLAIAAYFGLG